MLEVLKLCEKYTFWNCSTVLPVRLRIMPVNKRKTRIRAVTVWTVATKWAVALARTVFRVAILIFAWTVCLVFVAVADKVVE